MSNESLYSGKSELDTANERIKELENNKTVLIEAITFAIKHTPSKLLTRYLEMTLKEVGVE